jgi:chemotaxis protein MotB
MRQSILSFALIALFISACVPSKKYNELLEREKTCAEALAKYKKMSLDYESLAKELELKFDLANKELIGLRKDTAEIGELMRLMSRNYGVLQAQTNELENSFNNLKNLSAKETATLQAELKIKNLSLQEKEDALLALDLELKEKERLLSEREKRVNELEELLRKKEDGIRKLKERVARALKGFEGQGLTVEQRNGRIYVSLEAKLLFRSGSTAVEEEGTKALIELGRVLENEKDLEIIVEGHTDSDRLTRATAPRNNWELSVLRATSVVEIILNNSSVTPSQLMAAGRGEFYPVSDSDKAKNRRIEVIISPNLNELYEIISKD